MDLNSLFFSSNDFNISYPPEITPEEIKRIRTDVNNPDLCEQNMDKFEIPKNSDDFKFMHANIINEAYIPDIADVWEFQSLGKESMD